MDGESGPKEQVERDISKLGEFVGKEVELLYYYGRSLAHRECRLLGSVEDYIGRGWRYHQAFDYVDVVYDEIVGFVPKRASTERCYAPLCGPQEVPKDASRLSDLHVHQGKRMSIWWERKGQIFGPVDVTFLKSERDYLEFLIAENGRVLSIENLLGFIPRSCIGKISPCAMY